MATREEKAALERVHQVASATPAGNQCNVDGGDLQLVVNMAGREAARKEGDSPTLNPAA